MRIEDSHKAAQGPMMGIGTQVDEYLTRITTDYVAQYSVSLCAALRPIAITGVTIYIFFQGWTIVRGHSSDTLPTLLIRAFRIAFIATLALVAGHYQTYITGMVTSIQNGLIEGVTGNPNVGAFMDDVVQPYKLLAAELFKNATTSVWPDIGMLFAALLIILAGIATLVVGLGYYCLCKVALMLLFAVGPAFILCAMFPATQRFAENWIAQALNYAVLMVLVCACILMVADFGRGYVQIIYDQKDLTNVLWASMALCMAVGGLLVGMLNLNNIATALTGGISLAGIGREVAGWTMRLTGANGRTGAAGGVIRRGADVSAAVPIQAETRPNAGSHIYQQAGRLAAQREAANRGIL